MNKDVSFFRTLIQAQFIGSFASAFDKVQDWTSMQSLIVVSTIDEHYDVLISHEEMKGVESLEVLHKMILQKMND